MEMPPRSPDTNIVSSWMKLLILIVSLTGGIVALTLFLYYYQLTGSVISARSVTFAALGINSLVYVFSVRTLTEPFWKENPLENKWLNLAVIAGLFFQILPFTSSTLRNFFEVEALTLDKWIAVFISSGIMFIIIEISKVVFRHKLVPKS
jgi:magnesium-transporting ATPase (P-type)